MLHYYYFYSGKFSNGQFSNGEVCLNKKITSMEDIYSLETEIANTFNFEAFMILNYKLLRIEKS